MSILITGANGVIGKDLVKILSRKHNIYGIYRTKNKEIKKIKNVKWIKHNLKKKIKKIYPSPKYIIHCAVDQRYKEKKNDKYIKSNYKLFKNIVDFAGMVKAKLIINFSSIEVYGNINTKILNESYKPNNPNAYGKIKFYSEKYLHNQKINFINIRLPGVLCEFNQKDSERPWLNTVFNKMKKNKSVIIHNAKTKFNSVINTKDIANLINYIINKNIRIRDTFNFVGSNPIKIENLLNFAKKKIKSKSKIVKSLDHNKNSFTISTNKLEKKLKFKSQTIEKIVKNHLQNNFI